MDDNDNIFENKSTGVFSAFFKKISFLGVFRKLKRLFKIRLAIYKRIQVDSNLIIQGIRLPYTLKEFNSLGRVEKNRLDKVIAQICREHSITRCIMPASCSCTIKSCEKNNFEGRIVYTALAEYILKDLCSRRGLNIREIDIAIVQGEDDLLPYIIIKLLSPVVKFITLVTEQRDLMDKKIEEVCDETGLSVRITDNLKDVLKNCDLVINYGKLKTAGIKNNINSNAIIINYGELENTLAEIKKAIINGVDIGLGDKYLQGFEKEIFKFYSSTEIAEIVLISKIDRDINNLQDLLDVRTVSSFKKAFIEEAFWIKGYL